MHIRILAGAIGIFVSFLLYYGASYYLMLRYYKEKDRNTNIAIITLMVILVVLSFLFGYFVKNPYL
jgi:amino acid transporter